MLVLHLALSVVWFDLELICKGGTVLSVSHLSSGSHGGVLLSPDRWLLLCSVCATLAALLQLTSMLVNVVVSVYSFIEVTVSELINTCLKIPSLLPGSEAMAINCFHFFCI